MINQELAKIFYEIADILEADRVAFKPQAWRKAALALEANEDDAAGIYESGGLKALKEISGVGQSIAQKIEEYLKTGKIKYYQKLKKSLPVNLEEITTVEGVGPKRAKILYQELDVKNLADLEKAATNHKIAKLAGFGEKSELNIQQGINFQKRSLGRFLLAEMLPRAREIKRQIEMFEGVKKVEIAGSLRRKKETIGDIDFLATISQAKKNAVSRAMDQFTALPDIEKIWAKGATKASVRFAEGFACDLRILPKRSFGAAWQYFTGSKDHNIALRRIAMEKKLKLSEYGLFKGAKMLPSASEEKIYSQLGMEWIPPEIRENTGEIQLALRKNLPALIGYDSLRGDLHCHSNYSDGKNTVGEIALAAIKMGYEYVGIADHTKFLKIANGLDEKQLEARDQEIGVLNDKFKKQGINFTILKGCEVNILPGGLLDIDDSALKKLDFVIAGIHSNFKMGKNKMTESILAAIKNPNVDIISHLTGRLLKKREPYEIDTETIFAAAKRTGTILEINAQSRRLDLNDQNIRRALDYGVKMVINTDVHHINQLRFAEFGIAQARRGWAQKQDIINTYPLVELLNFFKK